MSSQLVSNHIYRIFEYIRAKNWDQLTVAAYGSLKGSTVDQIVRLIQAPGSPLPSLNNGGTTLSFKSEDGSVTSSVLCSPFIWDVSKSKVQVTANPFVLASNPQQITSQVPSHEIPKPTEMRNGVSLLSVLSFP